MKSISILQKQQVQILTVRPQEFSIGSTLLDFKCKKVFGSFPTTY